MKIPSIIFAIAVLLLAEAGFAQNFVNLNFESANVPTILLGQPSPGVSSTNGIPGWTPYFNGQPVSQIAHNDDSIGGALIIIEGPDWFPSQILQGLYSVKIFGDSNLSGNSENTNTTAIGQAGQIPANALSLTFLGSFFFGVQVMFNGQSLPYSAIGSGANYTIYGADISAFAGQTGELRFFAPINASGLLDDIQFSTQPIPEPSGLALFDVSTLLFGFFRRRKSSR